MLLPFLSKIKISKLCISNAYLASFYCTSKPSVSDQASNPNIHQKLYPPNSFEKKMLVWTGRYKSQSEIPSTVPVEQIEKARNKTRIKVANYMMVATLVGCLIMAITGKRAAERGESVAQMNLDWHKEMNKESKK